ncbi:unnamed protein product [Leptidea sinapis]|uniref:Uncharacterized protein n=1 Tax=Leptidea sinapis TaxID=189913 RepID=A0A5E4R3G4_9NEOP|nr:unnamed protein product [Leptidea sinapis]
MERIYILGFVRVPNHNVLAFTKTIRESDEIAENGHLAKLRKHSKTGKGSRERKTRKYLDARESRQAQ